MKLRWRERRASVAYKLSSPHTHLSVESHEHWEAKHFDANYANLREFHFAFPMVS
jgi:hypothetical protein